MLGANGLPLLEQMLDGERSESKSAPVTIEGEVLAAESDDSDDE